MGHEALTNLSRTTNCTCGRRKAVGTHTCTTCWKKRKAALHAEAREIVATGTCPECGQKLVRNLALSGWWQCAALGTEDNKRRNGCQPGTADCGYQTFTD